MYKYKKYGLIIRQFWIINLNDNYSILTENVSGETHTKRVLLIVCPSREGQVTPLNHYKKNKASN